MPITDKIAAIKTACGIDDAEKRLSAVGLLLAEVELSYNDVDEKRIANQKESIKRKDKIRDELEPKIEDLEDKLKLADDDKSVETLTEENKTLKGQVEEYNKIRRTSFVEKWGAIFKHPDFEKIKVKIKMPEDANGETDWKDVSNEDIFANQEVIQVAEGYGLFNKIEKKPGGSHIEDKKIVPPGKDPMDALPGGDV